MFFFFVLLCFINHHVFAEKASVNQIQLGFYATCVLIANTGRVKCWGSNNGGIVGNGISSTILGDNPGEVGVNLPFVNLGTGMDGFVTSISFTSNHICAVSSTGKMKCWGSSSAGQLGYANGNDLGNDPNEMGDNLPFVDIGSGYTPQAVSSGEGQTCVLTTGQRAKCWGWGADGRIGSGSTATIGKTANTMGDNLPIISFPGGVQVRQITTGYHHTCAILVNDNLHCFGDNTYGQLGIANTITAWGNQANQMGSFLPIVNVGGIASKVYVGASYTCVIMNTGSVKCFGYNGDGQLGIGTTANKGRLAGDMGTNLAAVNLGTGRTASSLTMGFKGPCAVLDDSSVKCWGSGVLTPSAPYGFGDRTYKILSLSGSVNDPQTTCATWDGGQAYPSAFCWGSNTYGNLGIGNTQAVILTGGGTGSNTVPQDLDLYIFPTPNPTTLSPTRSPTKSPTVSPTLNPTLSPTVSPTVSPTLSPTKAPTRFPTPLPSLSPSFSPTLNPTWSPSLSPSFSPTWSPSLSPTTSSPSLSPSLSPTSSPSLSPTTSSPSLSPTWSPSLSPSQSPTRSPSLNPTISPTVAPTSPPSRFPTPIPTFIPTPSPILSSSPTPYLTLAPSLNPTKFPTFIPTRFPTFIPTALEPTPVPSSGIQSFGFQHAISILFIMIVFIV